MGLHKRIDLTSHDDKKFGVTRLTIVSIPSVPAALGDGTSFSSLQRVNQVANNVIDRKEYAEAAKTLSLISANRHSRNGALYMRCQNHCKASQRATKL